MERGASSGADYDSFDILRSQRGAPRANLLKRVQGSVVVGAAGIKLKSAVEQHKLFSQSPGDAAYFSIVRERGAKAAVSRLKDIFNAGKSPRRQQRSINSALRSPARWMMIFPQGRLEP
jgi:hypothetical protein